MQFVYFVRINMKNVTDCYLWRSTTQWSELPEKLRPPRLRSSVFQRSVALWWRDVRRKGTANNVHKCRRRRRQLWQTRLERGLATGSARRRRGTINFSTRTRAPCVVD